MKVLVGCEHSGTVRRAFRERGHDAWSCDILPADDGDPHHFQEDVEVTLLLERFDLAIFHPPCTRLAHSGVRWLHERNLWSEMRKAANFFKRLLHAPVPRVAVENPAMHRYALDIVGQKYTHTIHPWQFGHGEVKPARLWLRNLPALQPTNVVEGRTPRVHYEGPGKDRWKRRSATYQGWADAMAEQWGAL